MPIGRWITVLSRGVIGGVIACVLTAASVAVAHAGSMYGNYQLVIPDRYDFHTWTWATARCVPTADDCVHISAIPMPIAKAFEYRADAHLSDGRYTLTVDVPDGLRCGNVYYGPVVATRDVYSWDATTLQGTLQSSYAVGCDGTPGGTRTYPFSLVRL